MVADNPCKKVTIPKGEVKEKPIYTDTTKTKRSKRVLKISPYIMNILRELKDEQDEEAFRLGDKWVESDRLFVKWERSPMKDSCPAASTIPVPA